MAFTSTRPAPAAKEIILTPVITLEDVGDNVSISYLPDGKQMISASWDKAVRRWDLQAGKEIEKSRKDCEYRVGAVAVSGNGRRVVTAGGNWLHGELTAWDVETGIVKTFQGHSEEIICIDISADSMLLASGSYDMTTRIWSLDTGKLVAGPFESAEWAAAIRFSPDSKKLAVNSWHADWLEVWDIQTQKLDQRVEGENEGNNRHDLMSTSPAVFWTNKGTRILAAFNFSGSHAETLYEFDASTLETVGAPFKGHTDIITGLALSPDGALVASASFNSTIKLWAFESRQLLASFHVIDANNVVFSPDTRQLAYTTHSKVYMCNIPPIILASIGLATKGHPKKTGATLEDLLDSDASRRPRPRSRDPATPPFISCAPNLPIHLPARDPQHYVFLRRFRNFLRLSSGTHFFLPVPDKEPRDPLDIPATSRLHLIHSPSGATTQGRSRMGPRDNRTPAPPAVSSALAPIAFITRLANWWPVHAGHAAPPIVDVPLAQGKQRNATAGAPKQQDEDVVPDEYFDDDPPSQNPNSQQSTAAVLANRGEHGSGRFCLCF